MSVAAAVPGAPVPFSAVLSAFKAVKLPACADVVMVYGLHTVQNISAVSVRRPLGHQSGQVDMQPPR